MHRPLPPLLVSLGLGLPVLAARPAALQGVDDSLGFPRPEAAAERVGRASSGVAFVDGALRGAGPDYKVEFRADAVALTPALGMRAERNLPLAFRLESVGRARAAVPAPVLAAQPTLAGARVTYARGAGVLERYDVLPEGVHQTFLLPAPPPGDGDLIVRGRLSTELPLAGRAPDGGLSFAIDGVGGVRYGAVTGVDATGWSVPGELVLEGDALSLVLPEAFVERAAYPLLVDPLIGPEIEVADTDSYDDGDPDTAFDAGENHYLVVWERRFSTSDIDIRGQMLEADGALSGSLLFIESDDALSNSPAVATVRSTNEFLVAWQQRGSLFSPFNVRARSVAVQDGGLSPAITLSASANQQLNPDVGGDKLMVDDDAFVVWEEQGVGIRAAQVTVPEDGGTPSVIGLYVIEPEGSQPLVNAAITKSSGEDQRYVVVWQLDNGSNDAIYARAMTSNGTLLGTKKTPSFYISGVGNNRLPDVDGDGTRFVVAWQRGENATSTAYDVYCRAMTFEDGDLQLAPALDAIENDDDDDETEPAIVYTGEQYVITFVDVDASPNVYAKILDPWTCDVCAVETTVAGFSAAEHSVSIASMYHGGWSGGTFDDTLVVWESVADADGDVLARRFESPAGVSSLGGGCGVGGIAVAACPYSGNQTFRPRLLDGPASAPVFLAFGFQQTPAACGPCTIWPSLGTAAVLAAMTDADGEASILIPLPATLTDEVFTLQWASPSGAACPTFGVALSNGLELEIQDL